MNRSRQVELMNDHVSELKQIVDEYKNKATSAQTYVIRLESQINEDKVELEVSLRRANSAEYEVVSLRKQNYQLQLDINELKQLLEESRQRQIEAQKKFEILYQDYQRTNVYNTQNLAMDLKMNYSPMGNYAEGNSVFK